MKKRIILLAIICLIFITLIGCSFLYLYFFHTYDYEITDQLDFDKDNIINVKDDDVDGDGISNLLDTDADGDGVDNITDIVANARKLRWVVYDYSKGKYNNFFGKMGFIVCIDVPRISYANAGIYFEKLLQDDYKTNKNNYETQNGNTPATRFFFRRVRNIYDYCKGNNKLIRNCEAPKKGDLVFYSRWHIAMVTEVHEDGTYNEIEAAPWTFFTVEHKNKKWIPKDVGRVLEF